MTHHHMKPEMSNKGEYEGKSKVIVKYQHDNL